MDQPSWEDEIDMAVTVSDAEGGVLAMNQRSVRTFALNMHARSRA